MKHLIFKRTDSGNCRVYFTDLRKRLLCFQPSHRRGHFELLECSRDGEPSHTIDHTNYKIDQLPPADDGSTAVEFRSWYLKAATDRQRIIATFHPEAWQNDNAIEVDPGATELDVTGEVLSLGKKGALALEDNDYPSDDLRNAAEAPGWIKDWDGPFRISCSEVIQAYYAEDQIAAAC